MFEAGSANRDLWKEGEMALHAPGLDADALADLLRYFGIDWSKWKSGKTPSDLLHELRAGESQLVIARVVEVVKMRVRLLEGRPKMELVELGKKHAGMEPVMHKGPRAPSGKKSANETPQAALERELWEELHLKPEEVLLYEWEVEMAPPEDSRSFAGIPGIYKLYWNDLWLNEGSMQKLQAFWSDERKRYEIPDQSEEGKKRGTMLYFAWVPLLDGH